MYSSVFCQLSVAGWTQAKVPNPHWCSSCTQATKVVALKLCTLIDGLTDKFKTKNISLTNCRRSSWNMSARRNRCIGALKGLVVTTLYVLNSLRLLIVACDRFTYNPYWISLSKSSNLTGYPWLFQGYHIFCEHIFCCPAVHCGLVVQRLVYIHTKIYENLNGIMWS